MKKTNRLRRLFMFRLPSISTDVLEKDMSECQFQQIRTLLKTETEANIIIIPAKNIVTK